MAPIQHFFEIPLRVLDFVPEHQGHCIAVMTGIYQIRVTNEQITVKSLGMSRREALQYAQDHLLLTREEPLPSLQSVRLLGQEKDFDDFLQRFTPLANPFEPLAPLDGAWLETEGREYALVTASDPRTVWTIVESDDLLRVTAGHHLINRLGYLVTAEKWTDPFDTYLFY